MFKYHKIFFIFIFSIIILTSCVEPPDKNAENWEKIVESSKNTEVNVVYYSKLNFEKGFRDYIAPKVKEKNGIKLKCEKNKLFRVLPSEEEIEAKSSNGRYDIIIIPIADYIDMNKKGMLYPNFIHKLPNYSEYFQNNDYSNSYVGLDKIDDNAMCFYQTQLSFFYNTQLMFAPPKNINQLKDYVEENPDALILPHPNSPEGKILMQSVILSFTDIVEFMDKDLSKEDVVKLALPGLRYLKDIKKYLYAGGSIWPKDVEQIDEVFLDEQVHASFSLDTSHAYDKVMAMDYPDYTRAFMPLDVVVANTEYLAIIPVNADNKSGAMYVLNEFLEPDVQRQLFNDEEIHGMVVYSSFSLDKKIVKAINKDCDKNMISKPSEYVERKVGAIPEEYWDIIVDEWKKMR